MPDEIDNQELKSVLDELSAGKDPLPISGPSEMPQASGPVTQPEQPVEQAPKEQADEAIRLISKFREVADTVLDNHKSDREQIERVIQFLDNMVQLGPKTPRVYVEMLVAALRTKAETTTNAVKLLDSLAKLLAAGKGTQIFVQQNQGVGGEDLAKLLETPEFPDEQNASQ